MTKRVVVGLVTATIAVLVMFLGWFFWSKDKVNTDTKQSTTVKTNQNDDSSIDKTSANNVKAASYMVYDAQKVSEDSNTKLLFFYAPWCPQCRALDEDISKNISYESGLSVYKVDYDSNQNLRQKYGITLQTTVVKIDDSGNLVKKYVAYNEPTFANVKANLL